MTASTDLDDTLANIRARAEAATPGPWENVAIEFRGDVSHSVKRGDQVLAFIGYVGAEPERVSDDAEFIAHAPTDIELLLTVLAQVTTQRDEIQTNRNALVHKVAEQRAFIAQLQALDRGHVDVTCTFPDDACRCAIPLFDLRAALDGAATTTTDGVAVPEGDTHA